METIALDFIKKVDSDSALQQRIHALPAHDLNALAELASGLGYEFDAEEFQAILNNAYEEEIEGLNTGNSDISEPTTGLHRAIWGNFLRPLPPPPAPPKPVEKPKPAAPAAADPDAMSDPDADPDAPPPAE